MSARTTIGRRKILSLLDLDWVDSMRVPLHPPEVLPGTVVLYGLFDPADGRLRYVGYTRHPRQRYWSHIDQRGRGRTHKNHWIKALVAGGRLPVMRVLDLVPEGQHLLSERRLIELFPDFHLTNGTAGGDGVPGVVLSREARRTISTKLRAHNDERGPQDRYRHRRRASSTPRHTSESRGRIKAANLGEANHQARLTWDDVRTMRALMEGGATGVEVAERFSMSPTQVSRIRRREAWVE